MLNKSQIDFLKSVDPDRCRSAMFADPKTRDCLLTIYAFHAELAKVPELVSEPMIGNIRYQWWRDALEEIYSGKTVRKHEVTTPLAMIIKVYDIPRYWLDGLINGRERDLDPTPFKNLDEARAYCAATSGVLMQIAGHCADPNSDSDNLLMTGEAWGLMGLARSWKFYHASMLENLTFHGVLEAAVDAHKIAKSDLGKIGPKLMPAIAYTAVIPEFTKAMRAASFDPKVQGAVIGPLRKRFCLMGTILRGRI